MVDRRKTPTFAKLTILITLASEVKADSVRRHLETFGRRTFKLWIWGFAPSPHQRAFRAFTAPVWRIALWKPSGAELSSCGYGALPHRPTKGLSERLRRPFGASPFGNLRAQIFQTVDMGLCPIAPPKGFPLALWKPSDAKLSSHAKLPAEVKAGSACPLIR